MEENPGAVAERIPGARAKPCTLLHEAEQKAGEAVEAVATGARAWKLEASWCMVDMGFLF